MNYTPPKCYPVNLQHSGYMFKHEFAIRADNSVDPDQMASLRSQLVWIQSVFKKVLIRFEQDSG